MCHWPGLGGLHGKVPLTMRGAGLLALLAMVPLVSGCIAAAIPVAAGAVMASSRLDRAEPRPAPTAPSAQEVSGSLSVQITNLAALPPPTPATAAPGLSPALALRDYVRARRASAEGFAKPVPSALLSKPGDLAAQRAPCRSRSLAVFVDLDPGRGTFDPLAPAAPDQALVAALDALRDEGVAVVWFSRAGDNFADPIRQALTGSGYDKAGRDQLVLMRTIDERKQTRRDALADFLCPIALVGDEKADFDELYLYLKNTDAALALDSIIGDGWFLVSPFANSAPSMREIPR